MKVLIVQHVECEGPGYLTKRILGPLSNLRYYK